MSTLRDVVEWANRDPQFRKRLTANPAAACKEAGVAVPAGKILKVVEPQPQEIYLVLEPAAGELGDADLDAVAGGAGMDGISYLVAVTQMKASNANEDALSKSASTPKTPQPQPPKPTRPQ